jgi:hypothetical protein
VEVKATVHVVSVGDAGSVEVVTEHHRPLVGEVKDARVGRDSFHELPEVGH